MSLNKLSLLKPNESEPRRMSHSCLQSVFVFVLRLRKHGYTAVSQRKLKVKSESVFIVKFGAWYHTIHSHTSKSLWGTRALLAQRVSFVHVHLHRGSGGGGGAGLCITSTSAPAVPDLVSQNAFPLSRFQKSAPNRGWWLWRTAMHRPWHLRPRPHRAIISVRLCFWQKCVLSSLWRRPSATCGCSWGGCSCISMCIHVELRAGRYGQNLLSRCWSFGSFVGHLISNITIYITI